MEESKSTALIKKRKSELALMPPPPSIKKIKRPTTVLDEDTYLDGLSHIIARDYFPGLATTEAKRDFLAALESKDDGWIRETGSKLNRMLDGHYTPGRRGVAFNDVTPRDFTAETPVPQSTTVDQDNKPKVNLDLSLAAYQAKYTSEDNESFNALVDKQNQKNREKHAYLWNNNKIPSARQIAWKEREARLIEAAKSSMDLAIFRKDTRQAMPNIRPSAPKNSFMFAPDSVEDSLETVAQAAEAKSNAPPKAIVHANTRLASDDSLSRNIIPPSPSLSAINDAVAGRPRMSESEAGWETPRVGGYAFVDAEPTNAEIQAYNNEPAPDPSAILARLTKGNTGPSPFDIKDANDREKLHHRLVDKVKDNNKKPQKDRIAQLSDAFTPGRTPTPRFLSAPKKEAGNLTPAGQLLYAKMKGTPNDKGPRTPIADFDLTPRKKKAAIPGLTPRVKSKLADD